MKKIVKIISAILVLVLSTSLFGCKKNKPVAPAGTPTIIPAVTAPPPPHVTEAINSLLHGNQVSFGTYEQDGDTSNGKEPIEWIVSETWVSNNKYIVMLISKKTLFVSQYNETNDDVTWQSCSLRKYLNNDFVKDAFTIDEQTLLFENEIQTLPNPNATGVSSDFTTKDRVFVPDYGDYNEFDMFIEERADLTAAAKKQAEGIDKDKYIDNSWWMRTEGQDLKHALTFNNTGEAVFEDGDPVDSYCGVRVAIWLAIVPSEK